MSDTSSLTELARFIGRSVPDAPAPKLPPGAARAKPRPQRHSVAELLGAVLMLSARTRRMVLPKVGIDIDVFTPDGYRAVKLLLPH